MTPPPEPSPWIIVFDANVFLDAARAVGEPFSWAGLQAVVAGEQAAPFPHPDRLVNTCRALALGASGRMTPKVCAQVWTSDHIDGLVRHKAHQPDDPSLEPTRRGLGWSWENADDLVTDLVWHVVSGSGGDTSGYVYVPRDSPPLEHEDGLVYATASDAFDGDSTCDRVVVTSDRDFYNYACGKTSYPRAMTPSQYVELVRRMRRLEALQPMRAQAS